MSDAPRPTDVEISRALNALVVTCNDQGDGPAVARERLQAIVTGALGGEELILVAVSAGEPGVARVTDREHRVLGRVAWRDARWIAERVAPPLTGGYVPSTAG